MFDCLIRNGLIVDGSGDAAFEGDLAIAGGRIVEIAPETTEAREVIDASGLVVAPGFIDVHTHYDAQVMWDPMLSPSSLHGVTTVMGGNCGFSIAPVSAESADYVMRMLACVEGMPVESLEAALTFDWGTFGDWLQRLEGQLAINAGFLVGHSTIRRLVMGEQWQDVATDAQIAEMARLVEDALDSGAFGFSSSWGGNHGDHLGNPVPSRFADARELVALSSVLRAYPGTMLEFIPTPSWSDDVVDMLTAMSTGANAPLNWNLLTVGVARDESVNQARLAAARRAADAGADIVALSVPLPVQMRINLTTTLLFNMIPAWKRVLNLPVDERLRALADTATRARLIDAIDEYQRTTPWALLDFALMTVETVVSPDLRHFEGRVIGDVAAERGVSAVEAFLDLAVADALGCTFKTVAAGDDDASWKQRAEYWRTPGVLVGGSDAGAHLDSLATFAFYSDFVGPTVRERRLVSLEEAVHLVTDRPARLYGLSDRGRLEVSKAADVVVFDPATIRTGDVQLRQDMPNGGHRLFADSVGVEHVLVNGTRVLSHGEPTGSLSGHVLRPAKA